MNGSGIERNFLVRLSRELHVDMCLKGNNTLDQKQLEVCTGWYVPLWNH